MIWVMTLISCIERTKQMPEKSRSDHHRLHFRSRMAHLRIIGQSSLHRYCTVRSQRIGDALLSVDSTVDIQSSNQEGLGRRTSEQLRSLLSTDAKGLDGV